MREIDLVEDAKQQIEVYKREAAKWEAWYQQEREEKRIVVECNLRHHDEMRELRDKLRDATDALKAMEGKP